MEIKKFLEELQDPFSDDFPLDKYPTVYPENLSEKGKILSDMISLFSKYCGGLIKLLVENNTNDLSSFLNNMINESDEVNFDVIRNQIGTAELEILYNFQIEYQRLYTRLNELSTKGIDKIDYEKFYKNKATTYNVDKRSVSNSVIILERYFIGVDNARKQGQQYLEALTILYNHETVLLSLMQNIETLIGQYDDKNETNVSSLITHRINAQNNNYSLRYDLETFIRRFVGGNQNNQALLINNSPMNLVP